MTVETLSDGPVSRHVRGRLTVATRGQGLTDVTGEIKEWLAAIGAGRGQVCAFVQHTTASLTIQENADPDVRFDLIDALDRLAPTDAPYRHCEEGLDDMPGHIKAMVCGASVTMPCDGGLSLGTWQSLYLVEHRDRGRVRHILLAYTGS
ncbi:MAG: secondary thiamine-phosphate synthase enzyme YjbQ [Pseudomonadota bacterium]